MEHQCGFATTVKKIKQGVAKIITTASQVPLILMKLQKSGIIGCWKGSSQPSMTNFKSEYASNRVVENKLEVWVHDSLCPVSLNQGDSLTWPPVGFCAP